MNSKYEPLGLTTADERYSLSPTVNHSYEFSQPQFQLSSTDAHTHRGVLDSRYDSEYQPPYSSTDNYDPPYNSKKHESYSTILSTSETLVSESNNPKRGLQFWMCIVSIMLSSFVMSLDLAGIATALPVIISDLGGGQFEWVGSAYSLSATALLPMSGTLAQVFGRRSSMLLQLAFFAIGSALCGSATSVNILIIGRTIQGIGGGGIGSISQIIISDLVPLHERGTFNALLALAYALSTGMASTVAGALAENGQWRWFFFLNLPICALSAFLTAIFFNFQVPRGSFKEKFLSLDWVGSGIVVGSTTAIIIGITWGGVQYPWSSARVLVPLIIGPIGLVAFIFYESKLARMPIIPFQVMATREAVSGYLQGFFTNFYMLGLFFYLPIYFQACKDASPLRSGVLVLTTTLTTMPIGVLSGISVAKTGRYRPQLWLAWASLMLGAGLFSTLRADTTLGASIGFQIFTSIGIGILLTCSFFPILAPIPLSLNASALAFFMFTRFFSQSWGISIGGAVLQNELAKRIPVELLSQFPGETSIAFSVVPAIPALKEPLKSEVRAAFADSLAVFWYVLVGVATLGLLSSMLMRGLPLRKESDEYWGKIEERLRKELNRVDESVGESVELSDAKGTQL